MLYNAVALFQELQSPIARDSVRYVDNVVAFSEIQKAFDRATAITTALGSLHDRSLEELMVAQDYHSGVDHSKSAIHLTGAEEQIAVVAQRAFGEYLSEALLLGFVVTGEIDLRRIRGLFQFGAHLVHIAAETFDRFDVQGADGWLSSRGQC